jgi:hypothetical protein
VFGGIPRPAPRQVGDFVIYAIDKEVKESSFCQAQTAVATRVVTWSLVNISNL